MKVIIFSPTSTPIQPTDLYEAPIGGADQQLIRLYQTLKKQGHQVQVFTNTKNPTEEWKPYMDIFLKEQTCDVLIHYRKAWAIPHTITAHKKIFYSQDTNETPCFDGITKVPDYFDQYDRVILLSEYHKQNLQEVFKIDSGKISIIGNSIEPQNNPNRKEKTFIYISTPYRGLAVLGKIWKDHYKEFPDYKLKIYSSMKIYGAEAMDNLMFKTAYEKLKALPNVEYHSSEPRTEILRQLKRAKLLLYPNTYPETFCNAINDAMSCGTPFVTSWKGALKETGKKAGYYVEGDPYTEAYQNDFVLKTQLALANYEYLQQKCSQYRTTDQYEKDVSRLINEMKCPNIEEMSNGDDDNANSKE